MTNLKRFSAPTTPKKHTLRVTIHDYPGCNPWVLESLNSVEELEGNRWVFLRNGAAVEFVTAPYRMSFETEA